MRSTLILIAALAIQVAAVSVARADAESTLIAALQTDPAYKVRMQALRVLSKKLRTAGGPASTRAIEAIGGAATADESHLVRGLACFFLGQLGDERSRAMLARATKDEHAFVKAQAELAMSALGVDHVATGMAPDAPPGGGVPLRSIPTLRKDGLSMQIAEPEASVLPVVAPSGPPQSLGNLTPLVVAIEPMPGVDVPHETMQRLQSTMRSGVERASKGRFTLVVSRKRGFKLRGSIAQRSIVNTGVGGTRVTLEVRIMIATWPQNNLRHVVSAKASAETNKNYKAAIDRLETKVLDAAVAKAVRDAMAELTRT